MSEHSIAIVPKQSAYPGKESKAHEILDWLVALDVVEPEVSECILGSEGYEISEGAKNVVKEPGYLPFSLVVSGLEIITERQIFHTGQNGMEVLVCPSCRQNIAEEDWDFLNEWAEDTSNNLTCPLCGVSTEIHQYQCVPEWGFSDLGFTFWNWPPFTDEFIGQFKQKLGCDINVVYTRI